ncbi:MAG: alanine:cation symporter family protein [Endomicrobium sp.]|nr:alanine:cation symporter family protein [Endomicrobium sp.]
MEKFYVFIVGLNSFIWGYPVIITMFCLHLYISYKTGFIQRKIFTGIKLSLQNKSYQDGQISPFAALCVDLSGTVALGNVLGVSFGIILGGAGAVFWIFIAGMLGIATKYAESLLIVKFRIKNQDGTTSGGMMYVIEQALKRKGIAVIYAISLCISGMMLYGMFQVNEMTSLCFKRTGFSLEVILIAIALACCIYKGIKSISKVCVIVIPFMIILYALSCFVILAMNIKYLFPALSLIITQAFSFKASIGGAAGIGMIAAIRYGVSKAVFSSESGFGTNSVADATAKAKNPFQQALISSTGTFWDTCVCILTGLIVVTTLCAQPNLPFNEGNLVWFLGIIFSKLPFGNTILFCCIFLLTFSMMFEGAYIFEISIKYLFSKINPFFVRSFFVFLIMFAWVFPNKLWFTAELLEIFVMVPSAITLFLLATMVSKETERYLSNDKTDENTGFTSLNKNRSQNQNKIQIKL